VAEWIIDNREMSESSGMASEADEHWLRHAL